LPVVAPGFGHDRLANLAQHEVDHLVATLPPQSPAGHDREQALQMLEQLRRCLEDGERDTRG
jgi:hypothetical protein